MRADCGPSGGSILNKARGGWSPQSYESCLASKGAAPQIGVSLCTAIGAPAFTADVTLGSEGE